MRPLRKNLLYLAASALGLALAACQSTDRQPPAATAPAAKPAATPAVAPASIPPARQLGKSGYFLSLPANYRLRTSDGPDFTVYYFAPDTTAPTTFSGGLYLGGHPQPMDSVAGCRTRRVSATVLAHPATWTVQRCADAYTLNAVFESHSDQPWSPTINAFGTAKSAAELRQLLAVFTTLRHQAPPARPAGR